MKCLNKDSILFLIFRIQILVTFKKTRDRTLVVYLNIIDIYIFIVFFLFKFSY